MSDLYDGLLKNLRPDSSASNNTQENDPDFVLLDPNDITISDVFSTLFRIKEDNLKSITANMKANGFDKDKAITIWKEKDLLVEGHTRRLSAIEAGKKVWVRRKSFNSEKEAIQYAFDEQYLRRNQNDADNIYTLQNSSFYKQAKNKKEFISNFLKVSERTASKYMKILKAEKKLIDRVIDGVVTINKAYESLEKIKKHAPNSSSLKDTSGNVATISSDTRLQDLGVESANLVKGSSSESNIFGDTPSLHNSLNGTVSKLVEDLNARLSRGDKNVEIKYVLDYLVP